MRTAARRSGILAGGAAGAEAEEEAPAEEDEETARLRDALETKLDRLERRVGSLERELEEVVDPDELRETGNLILARLGQISRGASSVELETFEGGVRKVELDPRLSPSDNAERYYEEAARRERALEKVPVEIERARKEIDGVEEALERLDREGPSDELWEVAGGRPRKGGGQDEPGEKLPYRVYRTSGDLEVRVGKGAKSNEELTFHHSHTEDVWLHARQVPGAHVVLRWAGREGNPPRRDLQEAAVLAAVHSDARHSSTVGVDWTRRKYVRSPRKSAPGVVIPRNVQTLFVRPDPALEKKLRAG
jgi:predicted ribosome quality control (RQC) complex YloA/Tae2 family protein